MKTHTHTYALLTAKMDTGVLKLMILTNKLEWICAFSQRPPGQGENCVKLRASSKYPWNMM